MKNIVLGLALAVVLYGCTSLVSGGRTIPIAPSDPERIANARDTLVVPNIVAESDATKPILLVKFAFDGTLNDETRIPDDERQTIVSYIAKKVPQTHYYPGVGMQNTYVDMLDATLGRSMFSTAEQAKTKFYDDANAFLKAYPNAEIRLFVTGFSRGAATARHFMYIVGQQWDREHAKHSARGRPSLRFYALLYDTVSTGQHSNTELHLELTHHLDYLVHLVARDEPRPLYEVDIDLPDSQNNVIETRVARVNTVYLPGAHSDIGASYRAGIGDDYRQLTDNILSMLGLISSKCFDNSTDSLVAGKHDSRGFFDKLMSVAAPNKRSGQERPYRLIHSTALTRADAADIAASNKVLADGNLFKARLNLSHGLERFGFTAVREGDHLKLTGVPENLVANTARLNAGPDGAAVFEFAFALVPQKINTVQIPSDVVSKIRPSGSVVGVTYLLINGGERFNFFVDDILIDHTDWKAQSTVQLRKVATCNND